MSTRTDIHRQNLYRIFNPKSIAVVGTNKVKGTVPYDILFNILKTEFTGIVFPVSPGEKSICSVKAFKYVIDIPDPVDLAIIVFPSAVCHLALEQCGQKGIKGVVIISAGFKEIGEKGLEREKQLQQISAKYDMSIIGPNCLGIINTDPLINLNASFARKMPEQGNIGFLSQSGALCTAVLDYARAKHIGFSKFISFGNKADISEIDLMYYLMEDDKTKVILLYLEEVTDGRALMQATGDVTRQSGKPVLILKAGRTEAGASAAASHTGSLAGDDEIFDAAFKQAGMIRCDNIEEMFNIAIAFVYQPAPRSNKVAIITNAGGPGVLTTDAAIRDGLQLAKFSEETTREFKKSLPANANIKNPVDVVGDARADRYNIAMSGAFKEEDVDAVFVILTPQSMTDIETIAREVVKVSGQYSKPVYASFMGEADVAPGVDILLRNKIPHYILPESMCRSFSRVYRFYRDLDKAPHEQHLYADADTKSVRQILEDAIGNRHLYLPENEAMNILATYGLPVVPSVTTTSPEEAVSAAGKIGYPVAMKIVSDTIVHKSDVGGVVLDVSSGEDVRKTYATIVENVLKIKPETTIKGIQVSKMISSGEEVILGVKRDPSFGPVIMFGLGGLYVEVFRDVSFRIAPVDESIADSMIRQIKSYKILNGIRGRAPRDIAAIKECLMRLSQLAIDFPQIEEMDINPLMVLNEGMGCL
ncbi:MAG TPA: acetate--CoA ligase family protein, partial [Bacteroidales bacterium]|nr:acetate--CoA ligase family protein [Bacteroidales bacterium]